MLTQKKDPSTKTTEILEKRLLCLQKTGRHITTNEESKKTRKMTESPKLQSPTNKSTKMKNLTPQRNTITKWLSKDGPKKKDYIKNKFRELDIKIKEELPPENPASEYSLRKRNRTRTEKEKTKSKSNSKQRKIDLLLKNTSAEQEESLKDSNNTNKTKKTKFARNNSSESLDLPSFKNIKEHEKNKKDDAFKKYGLALPSVEEILKDQKELEQYKNQVETFKTFADTSFDIPFSVTDFNKTEENCENLLDCKHLSIKKISKAFKRNLDYISDIFHGKKYCERHERFYNKNNKSSTFTTKDLSYNTSMIVFTFEQKDHMATLLKDQFDPKDRLTQYFFQVLLPELCLKIFMDTHDMNYDEAVQYLETRPITDD